MKLVTSMKHKARRIALGMSGLVVGAMTLGLAATSSANAYYGNNYNNYNHNNYGGYGQYTMHHNHHHRVYSHYRWVYDPHLHRWVLIGYNTYAHRWELVYNYDRWDSHHNDRWDNRNGSYWYND